MQKIKVSIIVPIYNAEKTLIRCLESLVEQTYKNIEILLINDGSTDKSEKICINYSRLYPSILLINQNNAGPATARNTGLELATGEYVYFVDADDYIECDAIEQMVLVAEKNNAEMVICSYYRENTGETIVHQYKYATGFYRGEKVKNIAVELINDVSKKRIPPYVWIRMIRRDILENPRLRFSDGIIRSEDYYFSVQLHFRIKKFLSISF